MAAPRNALPIAVLVAVAAGAIVFVMKSAGPSRVKAGKFSGDRALDHVAKLVAFGPREPGSEASGKAGDYIETQLAKHGWVVKREAFSDLTPRGEMSFVNLRARHAPAGDDIDWNDGGGLVLLCSHYDTKIFADFRFDGANDGGSSTGVLLELGKALAEAPTLAEGVELVFFDGEEAVVEFTAVDGLYGSRKYAKLWRSAPKEKKPSAAFVLDLVGDRSLRIDPPSDSPRDLLKQVYAAAEATGHRKLFGLHASPITDDHVPLNAAGVPAIDLIDADYISRGRWHTASDQLETVTAKSLQIIGDVVLRVLEDRHRETR